MEWFGIQQNIVKKDDLLHTAGLVDCRTSGNNFRFDVLVHSHVCKLKKKWADQKQCPSCLFFVHSLCFLGIQACCSPAKQWMVLWPSPSSDSTGWRDYLQFFTYTHTQTYTYNLVLFIFLFFCWISHRKTEVFCVLWQSHIFLWSPKHYSLKM